MSESGLRLIHEFLDAKFTLLHTLSRVSGNRSESSVTTTLRTERQGCLGTGKLWKVNRGPTSGQFTPSPPAAFILFSSPKVRPSFLIFLE